MEYTFYDGRYGDGGGKAVQAWYRAECVWNCEPPKRELRREHAGRWMARLRALFLQARKECPKPVRDTALSRR